MIRTFRSTHRTTLHRSVASLPSARPTWLTSGHETRRFKVTAVASTSVTDGASYQPFTSIPSLPTYPLIGSMLAITAHDPSKTKNQYHLAQKAIHEQYGPLVRLQMPGAQHPTLWIADPDIVTQVFQTETKFPSRPPLSSWVYYRQQHQQPMGIALSDGEEWRRVRMAAQGLIFNPQRAQKAFTQCVNPPTRLAMDKIEQHLRTQGPLAMDGKQTVDIENLVMRWSIEAVSNVLLGRPLGALNEAAIPIAQRMIDSFLVMMRTFGPIMRMPEWMWKWQLNKVAREHFKALADIHQLCDELTRDVIKDMAKLAPEQLEGTFLGHVLARPEALSHTEVMVMTADFLQAGIDTTSRTALNIMYFLSRNPRVQAKLRDEIVSVVGRDDDLTVDQFSKLKYFKNVLKETFRILPNFPQNGRILTQDAILGGYLIPAGTSLGLNQYVMSHDEKLVANPSVFLPERWDSKDVHSAVVLPFGSGARRCIGSRVAEIELHVLFVHLLRRFELVAAPEEMEVETTTGITPIGPTPLRLKPIQV
ncbi:cytochrome P450 [Catenaria anguillulae PL171]|uniref:Cytochrome P450 n=1 Tax=Catenaria anguillulae PL171 TaxID=765915 RepID=A0A1Y2I1U4_9FUNG|nr:cytochrome P450 [Catenaria anguillulae PL171]